MIYKCIRNIPFDIEVCQPGERPSEINYMNMEFEYCYTVNNGDIYLRNGDTIVCVSPQVLEEFFEEVQFVAVEEVKMNNVEHHKKLCDQIHETYKLKNQKYGDSFGISVRKYGLIAALTRMSDKFNRLEQLVLTRSNGTDDESLTDTLLDLSNYCLMTVMELKNKGNS